MTITPLLDKHGLAEVLNVPVGWVEKAITARSIPITWVGKHARFDPDDVAEIIAAGKERPAEVPVPLRLVTGPRPPAGPHTPTPPPGPATPSKAFTPPRPPAPIQPGSPTSPRPAPAPSKKRGAA